MARQSRTIARAQDELGARCMEEKSTRLREECVQACTRFPHGIKSKIHGALIGWAVFIVRSVSWSVLQRYIAYAAEQCAASPGAALRRLWLRRSCSHVAEFRTRVAAYCAVGFRTFSVSFRSVPYCFVSF